LSRSASRRRAPARSLLLALGLGWLTGCASTGGPLPSSTGGSEDPWQLRAGSYPSQRLYRVRYEGPEGKGGFKLTLYLASPTHYRMAASDSLGRKLWTLQVETAGGALWLDHKNDEYCRVQGADRLVVVPLAHLPLIALPRLLLGRLPADPVANLRRAPGQVSYLDVRGQLWTAVTRDGELEWWTLEDLGETVAWWRRDEDGGDFSDGRGGRRLTWKQIVAEAVEPHLEPLAVPPRFAAGACGTADPG
jgi:hypothetical protein